MHSAVVFAILGAVSAVLGSEDNCLSQLSAFKNSSSASWECASYVGHTFVTRRCVDYTTVTAEEPTTYRTGVDVWTSTRTHTVTISETYAWTTVTSSQTAYGHDVVVKYITTVPTVTATATAYSTDSIGLRPSITLVTTGDTVSRVTAPTSTFTAPKVTQIFRKAPDNVDCEPADLTAACKAFLGPLERIYRNFTYPGTVTLHTKTTTLATTFSRESVEIKETTLPSLKTTATRTTVTWSIYTDPIKSLTLSTPGSITATETVTTTLAVPSISTIVSKLPTYTTTIQPIATSTPIVRIAAQCDPAARARGELSPLGAMIDPSSRHSITQRVSASSLPECCTVCHFTSSCAGYEYNQNPSDCKLYIVSVAMDDPGWVSDDCPLGQVTGSFIVAPGNAYQDRVGRGPCWGGIPDPSYALGQGWVMPELTCEGPNALPLEAWAWGRRR